MIYCKKCVMPNTRPGILFDDQGVCQACRAEEKKDLTDWSKRFKELEKVCDQYRGSRGHGHDCIIAVSGGKDSHFQTHVMKDLMGMNPLLVTVEDNFPMTDAGIHNLKNISEEFGCDIISLKPNIKVQKEVMKKTFEKYGKPTWIIDRLIYTYPIHIALKFSIPFVIYGENVDYEYGGLQRKETHSAKDQVYNDVAAEIPWDELTDENLTLSDLSLCIYPEKEIIEKVNLNPVYLSYFVRWNSFNNYLFARKRGFHDLEHEWKRSHHVEDFDQVDSRAYLVHPWMKYPKFGHASATDYASKFIRYGLITRSEGVELVRKHDHLLDSLAVRDFCFFLGYRTSKFWGIIDKFYNQDIFKKDPNGSWSLKTPVWDIL